MLAASIPAGASAQLVEGVAANDTLRAEAVATPEAAILSWRYLVEDADALPASALPPVRVAAELSGRALPLTSAQDFLASGEQYAIAVIAEPRRSGGRRSSGRAVDTLFALHEKSPSVHWLVVAPDGTETWHRDAMAARAEMTRPDRGAASDDPSRLERTLRSLLDSTVLRRAIVLPLALVEEADPRWLDEVSRNGIALYPVTDTRSDTTAALGERIARTGGRLLRWQSAPPPLERAFAAMLELMSGQIVTVAYGDQYRLPWEPPPTLRFRLGESDPLLELTLLPDLRAARWSEILSPFEWQIWLESPGRARYGWTAFAASILLLASLLAAIARRTPRQRVPAAIVQVMPEGAEIEVRALPYEIGRSRRADLVLSDDSVSRLHARLSLAGGQLLIEDLASKNGTWLASERVERAVLEGDQRVTLGEVTLRIRVPAG